jgi:hypothetical protein
MTQLEILKTPAKSVTTRLAGLASPFRLLRPISWTLRPFSSLGVRVFQAGVREAFGGGMGMFDLGQG